jgi:hypothetical protein
MEVAGLISISNNILDKLSAPARRIQARVELYECSTLQHDDYNRTLLDTFPSNGALMNFKIERMADDGKFFGFGVCQKLTVKLRDKDRAINIYKNQVFEVSFGIDGEYTYPCPLFRIEEVSRDENTNELTITAYDFLYKAGEHRVSELDLTEYTIRGFVHACANILNLPIKFDIDESAFDLSYPGGANFDGSETIREALNAVAEATQTIYFVDWDWRLTFTRLDRHAEPAMTIDRSKYFELKNKSDRTLTTVCHATEMGDNVEATTGEPGVVQYVRNNPFWDLREDVDVLLNNALAAIAGITISQFDCSWRGNYALEIGDKIHITTKNGETLVAYLLNDTLTYNGGLKEQMFWNFTEHTAETASNPVNLGEALKQTYARVDKANKTIELYVGETETKFEAVNTTITEKVAEIKMTTDSITSRVEATETEMTELGTTVDNKLAEIDITTEAITSRVEAAESKVDEATGELETIRSNMSSIEQTTKSITANVESVESIAAANHEELQTALDNLDDKFVKQLEDLDAEIITIQKSVETTMTAEDITIAIKTAVEGKTSIETTTGFKFDETGLTISETVSDIHTQITNEGMKVKKGSGEELLIADKDGVKAMNLHATNQLIIDTNSRFQDYDGNRTACFWIGG